MTSQDLTDSVWFHIGDYLTIEDIERLSRTCSHLYQIFTSHDFWSYLIRHRFGSAVWRRFIKDSSIEPLENRPDCRSKLIYSELLQRKTISFTDESQMTFDNNRNYHIRTDLSSFNGQILHIDDSVEFCYSLQIETVFRNVLPGRYDVIWRMKLDLPYILGETDFIAAPEKADRGRYAMTRWTQEDFLTMYRCFHCDLSRSNLWFYQSMGIVEINGHERCDVYVSMVNHDEIHAKHGLYLDFVELKLRLE